MKLKLVQLLNAWGPLTKVGQLTNLTSIASWRLGENILAIKPKVESYNKIKKQTYLEKYGANEIQKGTFVFYEFGEENENGEFVASDADKEKKKLCEAELEALIEEEVDIPIMQIPLPQGVSGNDVAALRWMFIPPEEEAPAHEHPHHKPRKRSK